MPSKVVSDRRLSIVFASLLIATGLLAGGLLAGCSGGPPRPKTVKAKGKVLYKNQPVAGASVAFLGDGQTVPALGKTDADGQFELTTSEPGDGAVPGMHKVTVTKNVPPKSSSSTTGVASMEAAAKAAKERGDNAAAPDTTGMSLLPEKYAQASTTDLSYEVTTTGPNDFTIELKD